MMHNNVPALIRRYLASKANSWSPATLSSETARLNAVAHRLTGNPRTLWRALKSKAPYTRYTIWTRVCSFWSYSFPAEVNPYVQFRTLNANYFKSVYTKERLDIGFDEAVVLINAIPRDDVRHLALDILHSGCRYFESVQPKGSGEICGKGSKARPDLRSAATVQYTGSYSSFWRQLKLATGLKPHSLRKLALTRAAANGAAAADLMEIAGWSTMAPAVSYLQPNRNEKLKELMR